VTLYADGTAIGSAVAADTTTTIVTGGTFDLADGAHGITARQTVFGQSESPNSAVLSITIDTSPPVFPLLYQGGCGTNGLARSVAVSGTRAYVADGAAGLQTGTTFTTAVQADGSYQYTVCAVDTAGNLSAPSAALPVTIDASIPLAPDLLAASDCWWTVFLRRRICNHGC
jgi:large repetitive protein